jgi:pectate lyase C
VCTDGDCTCSSASEELCDGECVDLTSDTSHCGACGVACAAGQSCEDGTCTTEDTSPAGTGGAANENTSEDDCGCSTITDYGTVSSTIFVRPNETYDGGCQRFIADANALGDGSQAEGQEPVFELQSGATLINVVLGRPAADGIHVDGDATLRNIIWEDVGEDALTIRQSGTVTLDCGSARAADDKIFQINAASTFRLSNFTATNAGKLCRQNGGTTFTMHLFIENCDISNMDECIFRTDSSTSTVSMTDTRYRNVGQMFIGVSPGNITESNNTQY